jgi:putative serine/threonine protein kinase
MEKCMKDDLLMRKATSKSCSNTVELERLAQEPYASVICYPRSSKAEVRRRLAELRGLGTSGLRFTGQKEVSGLRVLGKGCVGVTVLACRDERLVALKIRRVDADRRSMNHESQMLERANAVTVGPEKMAASRNFLMEQFIDGSLFPDWLGKRSRIAVKNVLRDLLEQCWRLDETGLDHGELSHAPKHLIVDKSSKPWIVDFESASVNRRVSNVTSLSQFLFMDRTVATAVSRRLGGVDISVLLKTLRQYKHSRTRENFECVLRACRLG